jgi:two-component system, sensor histidine kinase RegB
MPERSYCRDNLSHVWSCLLTYNACMTILSSLPGHSQLRRLIVLRAIVIAAQLLMLLAVLKILGLELNWQPMLLSILVLMLINWLSWLRLRSERPVSSQELYAQLCVDVLVLSVLLYYSGGSTNPFVSLYLLPLVIAAATLPGRYTWAMAVLTSACYSVLMFHYIPLPHQHDGASGFNTHVLGMWLGFVFSTVVVAYFVVQMAQAVRRSDETLVRVREEILRNERIVALGTQAAGAAHELGTPLSTMAVVINELQHEGLAHWGDELTLLNEQVRTCKRILDKILANAQVSGAARLQPVDRMMAELLDEWQLLRPLAQYRYQIESALPAPDISVDATLRAALMNLLNNAADAVPAGDALDSQLTIEIFADWDQRCFTLQIHDQGMGLGAEAQLKAGSAFFTTKAEGHGLGLFLANATIERIGGSVRLYNREPNGATTEIILPLAGAIS